MGHFMAKNGIAPELILCSSSVRTRQTLDLVLPHLSPRPKVAYEDAIYLAAASVLLQHVRKDAGKAKHVMVVAHDPGMHQLATELAGSGDPELLGVLAKKFPTAGLAVIDFEAQGWPKVRRGTGQLRLFMTPKRLP
jgi:phosphohistidine phosphatase